MGKRPDELTVDDRSELQAFVAVGASRFECLVEELFGAHKVAGTHECGRQDRKDFPALAVRVGQERCRPRQERRGRGQIAASHRTTARSCESRPGVGGERVVRSSELLAVTKSLLEVVADDLVQGRRGALQPDRVALVKLRPDHLGDAEVRRVANQDVPEAEAVVAGNQRPVRLDQVAADQREQGGGDRLVFRQRPDRAGRELPPDHGRSLEHRALIVGQPVEAGGEKCMDRGRDRRRRRTLDCEGQHLLDEQRISLGAGQDPAAVLLVDVAAQCVDQALGVGVGKRFQREHQRASRVPGRPVLEQLGSCEAEDENRRVGRPADEVLQEVEERRLGPLELVDPEDDRLLSRHVFEEPAYGPEGLLAAGRRLLGADGAGQPVGDPVGVLGAAQELGDPLMGQAPRCRQDDAAQRPVGDPLAVCETAPDECRRTAAGGGEQLVAEAGFPDARRPDDRRQAAASLAVGCVQLGLERLELPSRPTIGVSSLRGKGGAPSTTPSNRHARTGSALPLSSSGSIGSTSTAFETSR